MGGTDTSMDGDAPPVLTQVSVLAKGVVVVSG